MARLYAGGKPLGVRKLDSSVAKYRAAFEKFPHCNVIQLLHEQGGRDLAPEVAGTRKPVRGEYRGWDFDTPGLSNKERGDWEVFYCTEFAKRIRREFPGKRIMIGNGSSASEKIASLIRRGFDLSLIDQLGIESKGFQTMPELNSNREAPGMLWALRETGRLFGRGRRRDAAADFVLAFEGVVDEAHGRDPSSWYSARSTQAPSIVKVLAAKPAMSA